MPSVNIRTNTVAAHPIAVPAPSEQRLPSLAPMQGHMLRRSGLRPFACQAALVATASAHNVTAPFWYELNLYQDLAGSLICDIRLFWKSDAMADEFWVEAFDSLDEAMAFFESFTPCSSLATALDIDIESASVSELMLKALELRRDIAVAERQYKTLLGEFLYHISNGDGMA